jgi:hypothetical protein
VAAAAGAEAGRRTFARALRTSLLLPIGAGLLSALLIATMLPRGLGRSSP